MARLGRLTIGGVVQKAPMKASYKSKKQKLIVKVKPQRKLISHIPQNVYGTGNSRMIKMKVMYNPTLTTGSNPTANLLSGQLSWRLNNINMPFIGQASGNALPQGYTQAAIAFTRFKVLGVKAKIECYNPLGADQCQVCLSTVSSADSYDLQAYNVTNADMRKQTVAKSVSQDKSAWFNWYIKPSYVEGISQRAYNDDLSYYDFPFQASVATATTDEAGTSGDLIRKRVPKLHLAIAALASQSTAVTVQARVELTYYVKCYGKTSLPTSSSTS